MDSNVGNPELEIQIHNLATAPQQREKVFALIERNFPTGSEGAEKVALEKEFFSLLEPTNYSRVLFIQDKNGNPLSALAWKPFEIPVLDSRIKIPVSAIGLVVTEVGFRGNGLSSTLLEAAEMAARKSGALLSFLWSDLEFYMKRDYMPLGSELSWVLDKKDQTLLARRISTEGPRQFLEDRKASSADLLYCQEQYSNLKIGPQRPLEHWASFSVLPNTSFCIFTDEKSAKRGYCLIGKARDLANTLHEVVGDKLVLLSALRKLIEHSFHHPALHLRIQYPAGGPLADELCYWLGTREPEALALIKLLNPAGFLAFLNQHVLSEFGLRAESAEEGFSIVDSNGNEEFYSPDYGHLTQLFMSPFHPKDFGTLSQNLSIALEGFQPINPYFWGLDSV